MPINAILYEEYKNNHTIIELHSIGRSMEPQLNSVCTVYVMCCSASELSTGDIFTFFYNKEVVCHRFIFRKGNLLFEKGDNCSLWNKLNKIPDESIIGKVVAYKNEGQPLKYTEHYRLYASVLRFVGVLSHVFAFKKEQEDRELSDGGLISRFIRSMIYAILKLSEGRDLDGIIKRN